MAPGKYFLTRLWPSIRWARPPPQVRPRTAYAVAALVPLLVLALELWSRPLLHHAPVAPYVVGVVVAAWLGGLGPGLVAVGASAALVARFGVTIEGAGASPMPGLGTGLFLAGSGVAVLLIASLRLSYARQAAQELRFRSLVTATAETIWTTSAEGVLKDSPSWRAFTGQAEQEARGRGWLEAVHPEDRDKAAAAWRDALMARAVYEVEYRVRRPDGSYTPTLARAAPVIGADGRLQEWVGVNFDISTRHQAAEALRESEERFRTLIETIPQMVFTSTLDGSCDFHNPQILAYTGLTAEELRGWGWQAAYHPEDLPQALDAYARALAGGAPCTLGTFRLRRHDGAYRWFLVSVGPVRAGDGRIVKWFGSATDIHEQKQWGEALSHTIEARNAFLALASHELRTPVTAAALRLASAQRSLERLRDPARAQRCIGAALAAVDRLGAEVEELLDVSRIAAGHLALERSPYDLSASIERVARGFDQQASRAGSALQVAVEPGLVALGDRPRMERVAANLVANALRFGPGQPVRVSLRRREGRAVLEVTDRGIGISPDDQERIFDRFERAVNERNFGGLGLGLTIARHVVQASGGTIGVTSAPGQGATFTVELPLERAPARPAARAAASSMPEAGAAG
jgi:PAS domain S-box-containing protein